MQLTINSFRQLFPDKIFYFYTSLTFRKIPDISLTAVKFHDISRFSWTTASLTESERVGFNIPLATTRHFKDDSFQAVQLPRKVKVKVWTLAIVPLIWVRLVVPAALYNLGNGSWLAWANGAAAHYVAIHCPCKWTTGPMVQLADTPSPQSATLGLHLVAVATAHFPSRRG